MVYNYVKRIEQKFPCGCHIDQMSDGSYGISYCPVHKAAPDMYEALKFFCERNKSEYEYLDRGIGISTDVGKAFLNARKALAKAEGK